MPDLPEPGQDLLGRLVAADPAAWRELLGRSLPFASAVVRRVLARRGLPHDDAEVEEATADFFSDLYVRRQVILGGFRGEGRFQGYFAVLVANHARRRADARARDARVLGVLAERFAGAGTRGGQPDPADEGEAEEVRRALGRLPPQERLLFQLLYVDGAGTEEATAVLGVSREILYKRKHRLLQRMKSLLAGRSGGLHGSLFRQSGTDHEHGRTGS